MYKSLTWGTTTLFASLCLIFISCQQLESETPASGETSTPAAMKVENKTSMPGNGDGPLKKKLDEKKEKFNEKAPEDIKKLYAEGIQAVVDDGTLDAAKKLGDKAPDFTLKNALGEEVSLSSYLNKGPVILTWYRGGWCPYCNITLASLQEFLSQYKAEGASLIALTPEVPDKSITTKEKLELEFEVLSDLNNKIAKEYGLVFTLIEGVADKYQKGFDLHGYNGDESNTLPLAATYVIDTDGTIKYAFLDADYRNRAEPSDILEALRALKQ